MLERGLVDATLLVIVVVNGETHPSVGRTAILIIVVTTINIKVVIGNKCWWVIMIVLRMLIVFALLFGLAFVIVGLKILACRNEQKADCKLECFQQNNASIVETNSLFFFFFSSPLFLSLGFV